MIVALSFALAAAGWAFYWASGTGFRVLLAGPRLVMVLALAGVSWLIAAVLIVAWRRQKIGGCWLVLATAFELGRPLLHRDNRLGRCGAPARAKPCPSPPGRAKSACWPESRRRRQLAGPGQARRPISPSTGFSRRFRLTLTSNSSRTARAAFTPANLALLRRYGVTHGVWDGPVDSREVETRLETHDPARRLVLVIKSMGSPPHPLWRLVRYPAPFPGTAGGNPGERIAPRESALLAGISSDSDPRTVWFLAQFQPDAPAGPPASRAEVTAWDGSHAVVAHDGTCDLVVNRTYYPGWFAAVNNGPLQPALRAKPESRPCGSPAAVSAGSASSTSLPACPRPPPSLLRLPPPRAWPSWRQDFAESMSDTSHKAHL